MKFTLATKQQMTQFFAEDGTVVPATILKASFMTVTQVKQLEKDGYVAIQVGSQLGDIPQKASRVTKAELGKGGVAYRVLKEFRTDPGDISVGATIACDIFQKGDTVIVSGISKGKGFQGVVKRHGFKGGWGQHGQKHSAREAGSIGATWPQRVLKGKRMAGRMGSDRITQKNLTVLDVDQENGLILIKGAIPGKRGTLVEIKG